MTVTPGSVLESIEKQINGEDAEELCSDIAELVDMFCCLFDMS